MKDKKPKKYRVDLAEPQRFWALSSTGDASGMLCGQYQFPYEYTDEDMFLSNDHDRLISWDADHFRQCMEKHGIKGEAGFSNPSLITPEKMLDFLKDIFQVEKKYPEVKWTGWRILGTVNRSNGFPVFSLQLFANNSEVEVYSNGNAPNVKGYEEKIDSYYGWD